jgi:hypothetical protein
VKSQGQQRGDVRCEWDTSRFVVLVRELDQHDHGVLDDVLDIEKATSTLHGFPRESARERLVLENASVS